MLRESDFKFRLEGERLRGSWELVRMRNDNYKSKHNNWLLIKRRDGLEKEGDGDALLAEDRSIASGRAMAEIAAGKGRKPKPFMLKGLKTFQSDAVWNSNRGSAAELRASGKTIRRHLKQVPQTGRPSKARRSRLCRASSNRNSVSSWTGHQWNLDGATRSSSTAIACSSASKAARPRCEHGKDSIGPRSPRLSQRRRVICPIWIIDGEVIALDHNGVPDVASLQGAPPKAKPIN
jgi:bifunctional non-homologous end joining protein LigD